jgi:hypothetical protein
LQSSATGWLNPFGRRRGIVIASVIGTVIDVRLCRHHRRLYLRCHPFNLHSIKTAIAAAATVAAVQAIDVTVGYPGASA